ncbi:LLM class F420-dependent oxidoreductase [Yinghuangia sp. YIM S09857]|uniref:LLM class F420-dependent oxidoreductase n=1 Tax=Yinghuangia sp. YIM S09857 TaxID=3436929 RepID=UPI003F5363EA
MHLGLNLGYWGAHPPRDSVDLAREAERLGYASVWTSEAWGSDAFTPLTWIAAHTTRIGLGTAIAQMCARTPTATAMHALTLDHLSGGRMLLGLGLSGPQVVEGWHGQPFPARPLGFTREYVDIVRQVLHRQGKVTADGRHLSLPYAGADGTGLGRPLKSVTHPLRADLPILLAAEGPRNVALSTEVTDGWLPLHWSPTNRAAYSDALRDRPPGFRVAPTVPVHLADDLDAARAPVKASIAFYVGGMGAAERNFHADLMRRYGRGDTVDRVQDLFRTGRRAEAAAAVPDDLVDEVALVGPTARIRDRFALWDADERITDLLVATRDPEALALMAELAGL